MADIRLSIIIPFYNVEKYIAECLDSMYNQDIPEEEYEVICVNDGSPDHSRDIVLKYMEQHSNLKLIEHECNKKLGAARNTGRGAARGKFIWNVDSDDMVAPNCFGKILETCEKNNLDVLEFGFTHNWGNGKLESNDTLQLQRDNQIYTGPQFLEKYYLNDIGGICGIWRKIYSLDFLNKNNIFSPPINMGEDEPFAVEIFALSNRIQYLDIDCYYYRRDELSLTGEKKTHWDASKWYEASIVCAKYMDEAFTLVRNNYNPVAQDKLKAMISYDISYWRNFNFSAKETRLFWKLCRNNIWTNRYVFKYLTKKSAFEYIKNLCLE